MNEEAKPRVLLITRNLPPLMGGMEWLNWHMAAELAKYVDIRIIGPRGAASLAPGGVLVREVPLRPLWYFLGIAAFQAVREAIRFRPHIVLAGSGLTAPIAIWTARSAKAAAVVYVHGLDLATSHPIYRWLWFPALRRMRRIIANSRASAELAERIGVAPQRIHIVNPGVALPETTIDGNELEAFLREHGLERKAILLSVGRLSERKGLREFVSEALPSIVARRSDALLLVVGGEPKDALSARSQTRESIRAAAKQAGVSEHVRFLGEISDRKYLSIIYGASNLHVFPVRQLPNDPEGFGMVAIEAAACGTPTVAFATGGVVDAVAEGRSGRLVRSGDYAAFADAVLSMLDESKGMQATCMEFAAGFAWPNFGLRIYHVLFGDNSVARRITHEPD
jgi:phosphatidylinositol alpha-1,6-mannosyltransferase